MRRIAILVLVAACSAPRPKSAPTTSLAAPTDTLKVADLDLLQGVSLGGERWAVLSQFSGAVRLVDWQTHRITTLGRPGTDYRHPFSIFIFRDTLYVNDWGLRRTTIWSSQGKLIGILPSPDALGGALPLARDGAGRFYTELRPSGGGDGSRSRDSGSVIRWRAGDSRSDTVARLAPYPMQQMNNADGPRLVRLALSGNDVWGVTPAGAIWVLRVNDNRLDQRDSTGIWKRGPVLPDPIYPVTGQDKVYYGEGFPEDQRDLAEHLPFVAVKPPFYAAFRADDGTLWLEKSRQLTDSTRAYQLLDSAGHVLRQIRIKNSHRILSAAGSVILADQQLAPGAGYLVLRYWLPKLATDSVK
ncbi:MAG: hypothetical protein ACHQXA_00225 [Gemmatimonadales bacterium]